jgi:hypothetical protein
VSIFIRSLEDILDIVGALFKKNELEGGAERGRSRQYIIST